MVKVSDEPHLELRLIPDASLREEASSLVPKLTDMAPPAPLPPPEGSINVELVEARDCQEVERVPLQDVQ